MEFLGHTVVLCLAFWEAASTSAMESCDQQSEHRTSIFREQGPYCPCWLQQATPAACLYFLLKALLFYSSYLDMKYISNGLFHILWRWGNILFSPIEIYDWYHTVIKKTIFSPTSLQRHLQHQWPYMCMCVSGPPLVYSICLFILAPMMQCLHYNFLLTLLMESFIYTFL